MKTLLLSFSICFSSFLSASAEEFEEKILKIDKSKYLELKTTQDIAALFDDSLGGMETQQISETVMSGGCVGRITGDPRYFSSLPSLISDVNYLSQQEGLLPESYIQSRFFVTRTKTNEHTRYLKWSAPIISPPCSVQYIIDGSDTYRISQIGNFFLVTQETTGGQLIMLTDEDLLSPIDGAFITRRIFPMVQELRKIFLAGLVLAVGGVAKSFF